MTSISTYTGRSYSGRSIETIVRREYGRTAEPLQSADPNSPHWGQIVRRDSYGIHVLNTIARVDD